jgi:peptide-methionine (S)-S-oxide reductase
MSKNEIVVAGGCFWGLEDLIREETGVLDTEVGYTGGENENPDYNNHPGHAEAVKITFDSDETTLGNILDYFFRIHDPTTKNQQGNDRGTSYRSAIFYADATQKETAEKVIKIVDNSQLYTNAVQTSLEPLDVFYSAEEYHQDYLRKNPGGYTCHFVRSEESLIT